MKIWTPEFETFITSANVNLAVAIQITLANGTIYRLNNSGKNLTINAENYEYLPGFVTSNISTSLNSQIDNLDIEMPYIDNIFKQIARTGYLKDAEVLLYIIDWVTETTYRLEKKMYVGECLCGDWQVSITLLGIKSKLDIIVTKKCLKTCQADLGDADCTVDLAGFTETGSITIVNSNYSFDDSGLGSFIDDYFQFGQLIWTGGNNIGWTNIIKGYDSINKTFSLYKSPPFDLIVGDTYSVYAGCDKSIGHCENKFSNFDNFRGFGGELLPNHDKLNKIGVV